MKLHHYAVFLRTSSGTVRRNIGMPKQSSRAAGVAARDAVQRHLRGQVVQILDVVPLRTRRGKGERTLKPRSRNPTKVTKVQFVLSRRPKARVSAILTKKGVRAYEPRVSKGTVAHVSATDRLLDIPKKRPPEACTNKTCIARGHCGHKRPQGVEWACHETIIKVGRGEMVLRVFAASESVARKAMRTQLKDMGLGHKRITRIAKLHAPDPIRAHDGRRIAHLGANARSR